jgi:multisite-specific tRNA:(cytosine-C5)-methyltransferase
MQLANEQAQKIMPEGEWEAFKKCLRSPLPATFRIAGTGKHAAAVLATLRADFVNVIASSAGSGEGEEAPVQPPVPLPWCVNA